MVSGTANDMVKPQQDGRVAGVFKDWERSGEAAGAWSRRCPRESWLLLIDCRLWSSSEVGRRWEAQEGGG